MSSAFTFKALKFLGEICCDDDSDNYCKDIKAKGVLICHDGTYLSIKIPLHSIWKASVRDGRFPWTDEVRVCSYLPQD
jgi:hypothetical protein